MAQNPGNMKFPPPIPNPLAQNQSQNPTPKPAASPGQTPTSPSVSSAAAEDDEKTDPNLVIPSRVPAQEDEPAPAPTPTAAAAAPVRMPDMGPLDALMKDPSISEIMVNDLRNVMVEKEGKLLFSGFSYQSLDELNRLTRNILDLTGRFLTPDQPYVDVMLPDGSRVNIVAPPLTLNGPCITIRKFPLRRMSINDLMSLETLDQRIAYFLNVCVVGKINILVSGGTGSGKTTLLNVLASFIPKKERIISIEDTPELVIQHVNSVRLQTKPQTAASAPVTARELVANSLRMRPDRIIVGECRRAEAFDMLQVMNTGHSGSMTSIHANSPRDALARVETLCMMAGVELPMLAIRKQIASALDLIIQIKRFRQGKRRVVSIAEVTGMEGDTITLQDIFAFELDPSADNHAENGTFRSLGLVPTFLDRLREQGIELPRNYFG